MTGDLDSTRLAPPSPVVIVGAGFLGLRVARQLAGQGRIVRGTHRVVSTEVPPEPGVELVSLDVLGDDDSRLRTVLSDTEALVICVAPGRTQPREALYVHGAARLIAAVDPRRCRRVVYVSSTSALPDVDGLVDETCQQWPTTERGIVQRQAEDTVRSMCDRLDVPWMVLRLGGLYGEGRELGRIYRRRQDQPLDGDGWQATNLIHVEDAVTATVAAIDLDPSVSTVVHVCDDDHRPRRELYAEVAARTGSVTPRWQHDAATDRPPRGKIVDNRRLWTVLGVSLAHPHHRA